MTERGDMDTKDFDARNEEKSRSVCERIHAEHARHEPSEKERQILDMWPRYRDTGEPVMLGDMFRPYRGKEEEVASVKIDCDGSFFVNLAPYDPDEPVERVAPEVLDADGVEIKVGDTVYGIGRSQHSFEVIDPHHTDPEVGEAFSVRCYDRDECEECHCRPELLSHTRPDSWERLEEDALKGVCEYAGAEPGEFDVHDCDACRFYDERSKLMCKQQMALDIIRRAKALAGVEADA